MSKRINELAFKYNIDARTDELSLFVSEIYDDGFHAGKQAQQAFNTTITLRDYFASLAMQSLNLSGVEWETTGKERDEESLAAIKELACDAYQLADAMLEVRGAEGRKTHCINYDEIEQLLTQPEQTEPVEICPDCGSKVTWYHCREGTRVVCGDKCQGYKVIASRGRRDECFTKGDL